jgi:hypothetical protein
MSKNSAHNERIKREYFAYLKEAKRHSEPTVDAAREGPQSVRSLYQVS